MKKNELDAIPGLEALTAEETLRVSGGLGGFQVTNDPLHPVPVTYFGVNLGPQPLFPTTLL